jgi:hypothetical protein
MFERLLGYSIFGLAIRLYIAVSPIGYGRGIIEPIL